MVVFDQGAAAPNHYYTIANKRVIIYTQIMGLEPVTMVIIMVMMMTLMHDGKCDGEVMRHDGESLTMTMAW